jgi:hypothetical protein
MIFPPRDPELIFSFMNAHVGMSVPGTRAVAGYSIMAPTVRTF